MPKTNVIDPNLGCKRNKLFFNGLSSTLINLTLKF
jgi:hypothetical protein